MPSKVITFLVFFISFAANSQDLIEFKSIERFNADGMPINQFEITVPAKFVLPSGTGPFPALVVSNSSAGEGDEFAARLLKDMPAKGYAVLVVHSFSARGNFGGVGRNQSSISFQSHALDSLYALKYLRSMKNIQPNKICAIGHSRGGQVSFNFTYFKYFLKISNFDGEPFDCNISVISGGHYRPLEEETTGKPALILTGELDDAWHPKVNAKWYSELIAKGENIKLVDIKGSYHNLTSSGIFCTQNQTAKKCEQHSIYTEKGPTLNGKLMTRKEGWKICGDYGFYCQGEMNKYPEILTEINKFLSGL